MKKSNNESHRHHYIPQFIIRNFAKNELGFVRYYDKKKDEYSNKPTEDIFKRENYYRDEKNNPKNPNEIEQDLAKFECEIAKIIKERFLDDDSIELTYKENDSLLLFLAIMQLRSQNVLKYFGKNASEEDKKFYQDIQPDGDLETMWKRNLGAAAKCRSLEQVLDNPNIDDIFKLFIGRDSFGFAGAYLIVAERRGKEDFFLSDAYPLVQTCGSEKIKNIPLYAYFPISPRRIIIVCYKGARLASKQVRYFEKQFLAEPFRTSDRKGYTIKVRKLQETNVRFINDSIYKNVSDGVAMKDESRFFATERAY